MEKLHLKQRFQLHPQVNLEDFVQQLPKYLTGADLYSLCSNAMLKNVERNIQLINKGKMENKIFIDYCLYVVSTLNIFLAVVPGHMISEGDRMLATIDFETAARQLVPSVSAKDLSSYRELERKINQSSH